MVGNRLAGVRVVRWTALCVAILSCSAVQAEPAAPANDCPGHPDAIGTSRTLVVDPRAHPRIGSMQYPETLPLADHEVVLTFDDGPIPKNSNRVLQILADNCVKATFFEIGEQARANPEGIRKLVAAGHTVGSHSQRHPLNFNKMSEAQAKAEIEAGIESIKAAMIDPSAMSPFFRIPGLMRGPGVEAYAEQQGLQIWSTDVLADDWHRISPAKVHDLAMKRLDEIGKGILLLHDIHERTAAALPNILRDLKARGYRIVHVVPARPDLPPTPTEPAQWQLHPPSEDKPIARWPKLPNFVFAENETLPAPAASDFDLAEGGLSLALAPAVRGRGVPVPREAPWPRPDAVQVASNGPSLPVPASTVFEIPEKQRAAVQPFPVTMHHYADGEIPPTAKVASVREPRGRRGRGSRQVRQVAHVAPGAAKHQARPATPSKRTHVASLKKRRT
jgi:peptidoglycan/xylan/chitin deacetylase (PgdA/CDA1 family)